MRQAYIGEDGRIYDADGKPADGKPKKAIPEQRRHRPMVTNGRRVRGAFFRGMGQASVNVAPSVPPPSPGVAYRTAARVAVPLAQGFSWSRESGNPSNVVYPGRFVVSDRYPGNLFRVAFRPPTDNNPALTRLAILEGTGAGTYIEVPIMPDGTTNPSLMGDFKVVPGEAYLQVEYSINPYPVPQAPGGDWKATFQFIATAIDQASYISTQFTEASTPVDWGTTSNDSFITIVSALGFIVEAIDMLGWAYDFGRIGDKELKILTKIGTDIFIKIQGLYDLLNPGGPNSAFRSSDEAKIEAFQKKVDEMTTLRPYWSVMLARATLYNQQTELGSVWLANEMYNTGSDWANDAIDRLKGLRPSIMTALSGQMPDDQLSANLDALTAQYQMSVDGLDQNQKAFTAQWKSAFPDYDPGGLLTYVSIYDMLLAENANLCMEVRDQVKSIISADLPCGDEGLGQTPNISASIVPPQFASVVAGIGPGVEARREVAKIIQNDLTKSQQTWTANNVPLDEAVARARESVAGIRKDIEKLQGVLGIDTTLPMNVIEKPAAELSRSVVELEDPAKRREARKMIRQMDMSKESALRQGTDNLVNRLNEVERNLDAVIYREDGRTPKPANEWTDADAQHVREMRDKASELLGEALTQSFSQIVKTPEGKEVVENVLAQGLTSGKGQVREDLAAKIATTVMQSAIDSGLFGNSALAGLGTVVCGDVGIKPEVLSREYVKSAAEFRQQAESLTKPVEETNPVTGETYTRTIEVGQKERDRLAAKADKYERLATIFASPAAAEGMISAATGQKLLRFQDVIDTATGKGQIAPATMEAIATADGALAQATALVKISKEIQGAYTGEKAIPEYVTAMATDANKLLGRTLGSEISKLEAAIAVLKAYTGADGQARLSSGRLSLKEVKDAIQTVTDATVSTQAAQDAVNTALVEPTAARRRAKLKRLLDTFYTKGVQPVIEFGKKSSIGGVIAIILMGPIVFGILWLPVQGIAWAFGKHVGNPVIWISDIIEGMIRLIFRSPRAGDREAEKEGKDKDNGFGGFFWTALGISMIFFGKQLFPVIGEGLKLVGASLKTVHDLIPWAKKKKGHRGRPSEGGSEKKLKGRGAPVDVEQAKEDLERAREDGDEVREQQIINKLKKAAERGQSVPPGLWGYYWR